MKRTVFVTLAVLLSTAIAQMTWTEATDSAGWSPRGDLGAAAFGGKLWVIGGQDMQHGHLGDPDVWYSTDGAAWTCAADSAFPGRAPHKVLVLNGKLWVIGGTNAGSELTDVWYSSDGTTWTKAADSTPWTWRRWYGRAAFDNKLWVMGGQTTGPTDLNDIWSSTDGTTWGQVTAAAPWSARRYPAPVVFDNKLWVISGGEYLTDVWYTADGTNWTQATASAPWLGRNAHATVAFDGKLWLIGGYNFNTMLNDAWYSTDGVNWTQAAATAPWSARYRFPLTDYDGKLWLCGGYDGTNHNDIWYTTGLGVEETPNAELRTPNAGPTVLSGTSSLRLLASSVLYDAVGRRATNPKPGVYFVRVKSGVNRSASSSPRPTKVIVTN
ncbi:hypothetical protein FJY68_04975 [candidate division WOR-3 bacterium]|uniref:Galactose oxidase n=1 Tax=candidate division WOR-3 bacterium TaxID=2052148 RepID=A0A937XGG6_UNCW3|nr:hypothetical protein [candidate division WOR-3 bacterium]